MQLRSLRTGLDVSTAHLAHNLLVKDALATMFARARLYGDAGLELTFMDISYEHHAARHPEMHVFAVNLEADLNPSLAAMRQEFLRRMLVQDGRMNTFVMRQYLFGARVRSPAQHSCHVRGEPVACPRTSHASALPCFSYSDFGGVRAPAGGCGTGPCLCAVAHAIYTSPGVAAERRLHGMVMGGPPGALLLKPCRASAGQVAAMCAHRVKLAMADRAAVRCS